MLLSAAVFYAAGFAAFQFAGIAPIPAAWAPLLTVALFIPLTFGLALFTYRCFIFLLPIGEGEINAGSRDEFRYGVHALFYLIFFEILIKAHLVPIPLMNAVYRALGARIGKNTYCSGTIFDANFVELGNDSIIGAYALLVPHILVGKQLAHFKIRVGNGVTIGSHSTILGGATIGDGSIIAPNSLVLKGTRIGPNELWGGVPARKLLFCGRSK